MPKAFIKEQKDIPEGREADYEAVEDDEGFRLIVEEGNGYQLAKVGELQSGLIKQREETAGFRRKLGEANAELKKLQVARGEEGKLTAEEKEGYENQIGMLSKQNASLKDSHKRATLRAIADKAIEDNKGDSRLLRPHVMGVLAAEYDDAGSLVVKVIDENGSPIFSKQPDRANQPITPGEHVRAMRSDATFSKMFLGTGKKGTDAPADGTPREHKDSETLNKLSPTEAINRLRAEQTA